MILIHYILGVLIYRIKNICLNKILFYFYFIFIFLLLVIIRNPWTLRFKSSYLISLGFPTNSRIKSHCPKLMI